MVGDVVMPIFISISRIGFNKMTEIDAHVNEIGISIKNDLKPNTLTRAKHIDESVQPPHRKKSVESECRA